MDNFGRRDQLHRTFLTNLTKVRPLFTHSNRGSENFPLLIMFKWTLFELCSLHIASWFRLHYWSLWVLIIMTNQVVTFMQLKVLRKLWPFNLFIWVDYMPWVERKRKNKTTSIIFKNTVLSLWQPSTDVFLACRFF